MQASSRNAILLHYDNALADELGSISKCSQSRAGVVLFYITERIKKNNNKKVIFIFKRFEFRFVFYDKVLFVKKCVNLFQKKKK